MPDDKGTNLDPYGDEVSLRDFLLAIRQWFAFLKHHRIIYLVMMVICAAALIFYSFTREATYRAELTFMLSDNNSSQLSGFSSVLGQFGLPLSSGRYNIDKLLEIARSRTIIQDVLFQRSTWSEQEDYIINLLIKMYGLDDDSTDDSENAPFSFSHNNLESFSPQEKQMLKKAYHHIAGSNEQKDNGLLTCDYGRDHYIMTFSFVSKGQGISIDFVNGLYKTVKEYYTDISRERNQFTYELVRNKRDSIRTNLSDVELGLARLKDKSIGSFRNEDNLEILRLNTESLILKTALAKTEENLAIAEFALENNTPLIQLIDTPLEPLPPVRKSPIKMGLFGCILGFFLASFWIFIRFISQAEL